MMSGMSGYGLSPRSGMLVRSSAVKTEQNCSLGMLALAAGSRWTRPDFFNGATPYASHLLSLMVPAGSPSRGADVTVYVFDINQPSLPTPFFFYSVLMSISVFMVLSTVFRSINSPDFSPLSHSVRPVLILSYWSLQLDISL